MKRLFTLFIMLGLGSLAIGQTNVYFKINQMLAGSAFAYSSPTANNLNDAFEFTRLEYYISEIKLTYDGGQDTTLADTYILVRGDQAVNELLGSFNFTTLESVTFGIGVDGSKNHSDPSTYVGGHPLSFQMPSMHWGWAAGYRFAALEGNSGTGMSQTWQLHALGDKNYDYTTVSTAGTMVGSDLIIALDANYEKIFKDITVNSTLNYHGEDQQAPMALGNFQTEVFSEGSATVGLEEKVAATFNMSPNPSNGQVNVIMENSNTSSSSIIVSDITGRKVLEQSLNSSGHNELNIKHTGIYIVSLTENGQVVYTQKLIVK
ncbi:hypothetical protein Oweho_0482 [Owenweeksia hongkongensis DSM 17368]|uniref:Uncharacterized protein n=1 Tax=Owenweeksia hongkongensis (strain DSM 17368 / CIP 108786 / JCM 12287 / NRRL B-23963 / UST20020801) TaxID=926562 RepID=G8QZQ6_OWEHD|nr:MbnP family protein [Owenweeksia hongkongensis]AEV31500.1 hypothetical protein Oweho_0482 [Owenweeksia hongkongensis DSM 17368]